MEKSSKSYWKLGLSLVKSLLILVMLSILYGLPDMLLFFPMPDMIIALVQTIINIFVIRVFINYYKKGINKNGFKVNRVSPSKEIILFLIAMYMIVMGMDWVFNNLFTIETPENQQLIEELFLSAPISMAISGVIIAPISEELIFRGIFFNLFYKPEAKFGKFLIILSSALVFGLIHETSPSLSLIYYSVMGAVLGVTYLYTKDIRYSIFLHFVNNAVAFGLMYLQY